MSRDLKLEKICDHIINYEQVQIDPDLRTIRIPRTLTTTKVTLWVNGFKIPSNHPQFGWNVEDDDLAIYTTKSRLIFRKSRKAHSDFYHMTYSVQKEFCPKCRGLRIHNDHSYSSLGKVVMVENEEKLLQEVKKGITTVLGSNPFHAWIGTEITTLIGSKVFNVDFISNRISQEVVTYLEKYLEVQIQQSQYQVISDREAFLRILSIDVEPQWEIDVSYWVITIIFRNRSGEDMVFEKKTEIPGGTNLLYGSSLEESRLLVY